VREHTSKREKNEFSYPVGKKRKGYSFTLTGIRTVSSYLCGKGEGEERRFVSTTKKRKRKADCLRQAATSLPRSGNRKWGRPPIRERKRSLSKRGSGFTVCSFNTRPEGRANSQLGKKNRYHSYAIQTCHVFPICKKGRRGLHFQKGTMKGRRLYFRGKNTRLRRRQATTISDIGESHQHHRRGKKGESRGLRLRSAINPGSIRYPRKKKGGGPEEKRKGPEKLQQKTRRQLPKEAIGGERRVVTEGGTGTGRSVLRKGRDS